MAVAYVRVVIATQTWIKTCDASSNNHIAEMSEGELWDNHKLKRHIEDGLLYSHPKQTTRDTRHPPYPSSAVPVV